MEKEDAKVDKKKKAVVKKNDDADFSIIRSKIYEIRGQIVMFDFDLAEEYEIETKYLKRAVRSNIERFEGDDFMFELSKDEVNSLRCNFSTLNTSGRGQHSKYLPFAFTELGIAMLSSVLNSEKAIKINRKIMRAFVAFRKFLLNYVELNQKMDELSTKVDKNDARVNEMIMFLREFLENKKELEKPRNPIGFKQNKE